MKQFKVLLAGSSLAFFVSISAPAAETHAFEAEKATSVGGASAVTDRAASGRASVALAKSGQEIKFTRLPAAGKLAIRYASTNVGTISVAVDDLPLRKINVHSSGAFTNSFLHAIIDAVIPARATLTVRVDTNDVAVNVDRIIVGTGDLDPQLIQIAKDIGAWLKVNGEAVYASRPFEVCQENANSICYTRNNGNVYAALVNWTNGPITLNALRAGGATLGKISKVEMLGSDVPMTFYQYETEPKVHSHPVRSKLFQKVINRFRYHENIF